MAPDFSKARLKIRKCGKFSCKILKKYMALEPKFCYQHSQLGLIVE